MLASIHLVNHDQRQAFVESTSFTTGVTIAGAIASLVLLMTPGGLLLAMLAGGTAAVGFDHLIKYFSGRLYDLFR